MASPCPATRGRAIFPPRRKSAGLPAQSKAVVPPTASGRQSGRRSFPGWPGLPPNESGPDGRERGSLSRESDQFLNWSTPPATQTVALPGGGWGDARAPDRVDQRPPARRRRASLPDPHDQREAGTGDVAEVGLLGSEWRLACGTSNERSELAENAWNLRHSQWFRPRAVGAGLCDRESADPGCASCR